MTNEQPIPSTEQQLAEMREHIQRLEAEVAEMRADSGRPVVDPEAPSSSDPIGPTTGSRRRMLRQGAVAVGAGVVAAGLGSRTVAAADPNDVVKDSDNVVSGLTTLSGGQFRARDTGATPLLGFQSAISGVTDTTFNGVMGSTKRAEGYGVIAMADRAAGARSQLILEPNGPPPPGAASHRAGELIVDSNATLWYAPSATVFRKIAGSSTSGALHMLAPTRVWDSRLPHGGGPMSTGQSRVISVADGRDILTGNVTLPDVVPAGATAVMFNLAVVNTGAVGFLSVTPGDAGDFLAASINWFGAGQILNNGTASKLDTTRQLKVWCVGSTDFVVDITAYTL